MDIRTKTVLKVFNEPFRDVRFIGIAVKLRERQLLVLAARRFVPRKLASALVVVTYETKQDSRER